MTALAAARSTPEKEAVNFSFPVLASAICYAGALAVLDASGWVKPAVTATGLVAVGRFEATVDNSDGSNGTLNAEVKAGVFRWANSSSTDEITKAEIGDLAYIVDDQTVAKTSGGNTRSVAGRIMDVDATGVWVSTGLGVVNAPGGALLAANNLSDVGTKATAQSNLGVADRITAEITVGAEAGNAINVAIQLKDSAGDDLAVRGSLMAYLSDDANGDSIAGTAPDGNVAVGTDGLLIPIVADKAFWLTSEADGDIDLNVGESGADTWYLILVLPDGTLVASDAITFA
ncbi:MAG: hypothetical protein KDJ90_12705 [Nitratireductor sp.]|nr:hypothetical protein [Nitratireductor sp.]